MLQRWETATGPQRRPVAVLTSIEGVFTPEVVDRCVAVEFNIAGASIGRGTIESAIKTQRHSMFFGVLPVFQRFFALPRNDNGWPDPIPRFRDHFHANCDLLAAYQDVTGKPDSWAAKNIEVWDRSLRKQNQAEENDWEGPIQAIIRERSVDFERHQQEIDGVTGTLFVTDTTSLSRSCSKSIHDSNSLDRHKDLAGG